MKNGKRIVAAARSMNNRANARIRTLFRDCGKFTFRTSFQRPPACERKKPRLGKERGRKYEEKPMPKAARGLKPSAAQGRCVK
jgi:hypothetical protein